MCKAEGCAGGWRCPSVLLWAGGAARFCSLCRTKAVGLALLSQHGKQMFPSNRQLLHAVSAKHKACPAADTQSSCSISCPSLKDLVEKIVLKHSPEMGIHGWHCVNGLSHPAVTSHKKKNTAHLHCEIAKFASIGWVMEP